MAVVLRRRLIVMGLVSTLGIGELAACAASSNSTSATEPAADNGSSNVGGAGYSAAGQSTGGANSFVVGSTGGATFLPPEQKVTLSVEVPKASDSYVYAANPDRNSVAIIDPGSLAIQTVNVDSSPQGLQILPNRDAAVVVNTGSSTVSLLTTDSTGHTTAASLNVMRGANSISVAPDGKHALIYYDANAGTSGPLPDSPKNISALDLTGTAPVVYQVTVGYRPSAISYATDSSKAFVVSLDGISIVDLQHLDNPASRLSDLVQPYDTTVTNTADVLVTPDGAYAVAHQQYSTLLRLVDLTSRDNTDLELNSVFSTATGDAGTAVSLDVSDIELAPDGTYLLAVVRNQDTVLRVPIPGGFDDASAIERIQLPNVLTGAVNIGPDGHYAVLYTTLDAYNETHISIADLKDQNKIRTIDLHKMVDAVAFEPTGKVAYVLHVKSPGDPKEAGISPDEVDARRYGYSVVDLATPISNLQWADSQPGQIAARSDGTAIFILFSQASPWSVQRMTLAGFAVDTIGISSQPTGIGFVPSKQQVFVSQAQTDGRITFIDWDTLTIKSVAGYELNSSIWE